MNPVAQGGRKCFYNTSLFGETKALRRWSGLLRTMQLINTRIVIVSNQEVLEGKKKYLDNHTKNKNILQEPWNDKWHFFWIPGSETDGESKENKFRFSANNILDYFNSPPCKLQYRLRISSYGSHNNVSARESKALMELENRSNISFRTNPSFI